MPLNFLFPFNGIYQIKNEKNSTVMFEKITHPEVLDVAK